ncbi:unnamed protein product [Symbiodinium necroappetens]|uniref:Reverse transcriptase domain-containing protein n=1 Tax=Symbiodinium necroappetens TaxID=1628268 RepID=A0A812QMF6_9DINO|nr:unnamed protein product [Symbiodinium necroappetens]
MQEDVGDFGRVATEPAFNPKCTHCVGDSVRCAVMMEILFADSAHLASRVLEGFEAYGRGALRPTQSFGLGQDFFSEDEEEEDDEVIDVQPFMRPRRGGVCAEPWTKGYYKEKLWTKHSAWERILFDTMRSATVFKQFGDRDMERFIRPMVLEMHRFGVNGDIPYNGAYGIGDSIPGKFVTVAREVLRTEIQGAVGGVTDRVAALERSLQSHNERTFQAVETLSTGQAEQGLRLQQLMSDSQAMATRINYLEGTVKTIQSSGSTPSTMDSGRVPALVMGGWPPDTLAADVLAKANEMARDLQLQISMADAFVPGVRRGFVLVPIAPRDGESDEAMRQRIQTCIRRVNTSNISLGWKPDGNQARLWLTLSQPPERRRRAALAGKVKRLIIEAGGSSLVSRIEPEWATGTVWLKDTKISSGTSAGPPSSSSAGCGWIDLPRIAELIGVDPQLLAKTWEPQASQQEVPSRAQRDALHFAAWNIGGMSPEAVLDFLSNFQGEKPLVCLCIVFLQEITTQGGPHFLDNETWMLIHGKLQSEWRGCGIAYRKTLGVHHTSHLRLAACTTCLRLHNSKRIGGLLESETLSCTGRGEQIDYVASRNLTICEARVGPKGKVIWSARQLKADCHQVLASAVPAHADDHHAIAAVAQQISEPVHRSMKFQESKELKQLRKAARGAPPGSLARSAWKQVSKTLQRERKEWQRQLADQAGSMQWNAYRAIKMKSSRTNWAEHLLDNDSWEGASVLLPKTATPQGWSDTRPITLSSAVLKWIAQLLLLRGTPALLECCQHQWASRHKQGVELILAMRKLARVSHEWRTPFYVVKIDIAKAFDSIAQEKLGDLVMRKIAHRGEMPWEARLWLRLLEARSLNFYVQKHKVSVEQTNGVRQGSPDSPVLFAAAIGETLDAVLNQVNGGKPPHVGRHGALEPPPHSGAAFMDDTYVWGESPEYVQEVLTALEKEFLELGLRINAKMTHVVSTIPDDPFRFTIGGVEVAPDGPHSILTILGAPVTLSGAIAPLVAEMQSRARCAFHANRKLLCSRAPVADRLRMHQTLVRSAALWGCPAWPPQAALLQAANTTQLLQARTMICGGRSPTEAWQDWHIRSMRKTRAALHQYKIMRWSTHSLQMQWQLWGHIGNQWWVAANNRPQWQHMCKRFIDAFDPPWAIMEADEVTDMPVREQGRYDPAADPWHEDGTFDGISPEMGALLANRQQLPPQGGQVHQQHGPPMMTSQPYDPWEDDLDQPLSGNSREFSAPGGWAVRASHDGPVGSYCQASTCANDPDDSCDAALPGEGEYAAPDDALLLATAPSQEMEPEQGEAEHETQHDVAEPQDDIPAAEDDELVDIQDDPDWDSDSADSEEEDDAPQGSATQTGGQPPKRKAGHGSQRVTNKARKSDVKKRWRELDWGKKPKWLSWRRALDYILRGEKPPNKEPLPHLTALLSAHLYSYDAQGKLIPHHPPRPHADPEPARGDKNRHELFDYGIFFHGAVDPGGFRNKFSSSYRTGTEKTLRDGVHNYPIRVVDNRPEQYRYNEPLQTDPVRVNNQDNSLHNVEGGPPLYGTSDLDQQAAEAIQSGQAPPWTVEGQGPSMRSSVRVDDNSHDISWVPGVTPRTRPPPMPLHPNTVLSMRGTATGAWRGATWSPPAGSVIQHPPRQQVEPTIVIYKTLSGQSDGEVLPDSLHMTIHPAGAWIATTRFELGFARTPRYWLVVVDHAPPAAPNRIPLRSGQSFWLEWRGVEKVWQRRPRFDNDVQALGGFSVIPEDKAPRPPTPPQRRDPPDVPRGRPRQPAGFNPQRFVDTRPLRGRLIQPAQVPPQPTTDASSSSRPAASAENIGDQGGKHNMEAQAAAQQAEAPRRRSPRSQRWGRPTAKAKPPPPPSSGSDTETSWPSEDPAPPDDATGLVQHNSRTPTEPTAQDDLVMFMQRQRPQPPAEAGDPARGSGSDEPCPPHALPAPLPPPPAETEHQWFSVAANFDGEYTVSGLLRLLHRIMHETLQQSFTQSNEYLTNLAYHACYYLSKLQSTNDGQQQAPPAGDHPDRADAPGPTAMVFCITNAFVEAEAALDSLVHHHRELPRRHLEKELRRAESLLRDGRAVFKSWARDPNAPGALPGTAASQNALDGVSFAHLSIEEGGVASLDENLRLALAATQRCSRYLDQLLEWIAKHFQNNTDGGSPSPKKRKTEQASGSDGVPCYQPAVGDDWQPPKANKSTDPQLGDKPHHPEVPPPAHDGRPQDPGLPREARRGREPEAAPYNILRAQQILEGVMPFTEQQVATTLQEVHSLLSQWTEALWGEPIVLTDSLESHGPGHHESAGELPTVELAPTLPAELSDEETVSVASHRRRRAHAAFDAE